MQKCQAEHYVKFLYYERLFQDVSLTKIKLNVTKFGQDKTTALRSHWPLIQNHMTKLSSFLVQVKLYMVIYGFSTPGIWKPLVFF